MIIATCYGISYTTIRTVHASDPTSSFTGFKRVAYIITFTTKLLLDAFVFMIFIKVFNFFLSRKMASLKREALSLTPLNKVVLSIIYFLLFMRIAGSIYTFTVGVLILNPGVFNTPK